MMAPMSKMGGAHGGQLPNPGHGRGHNQRGRGKERGRWQRGYGWYRGYGMGHNYNFFFLIKKSVSL